MSVHFLRWQPGVGLGDLTAQLCYPFHEGLEVLGGDLAPEMTSQNGDVTYI